MFTIIGSQGTDSIFKHLALGSQSMKTSLGKQIYWCWAHEMDKGFASP